MRPLSPPCLFFWGVFFRVPRRTEYHTAKDINDCIEGVVNGSWVGFVYEAAVLEYLAKIYPAQFAVCARAVVLLDFLYRCCSGLLGGETELLARIL